jgi:hypothetical protein
VSHNYSLSSPRYSDVGATQGSPSEFRLPLSYLVRGWGTFLSRSKMLSACKTTYWSSAKTKPNSTLACEKYLTASGGRRSHSTRNASSRRVGSNGRATSSRAIASAWTRIACRQFSTCHRQPTCQPRAAFLGWPTKRPSSQAAWPSYQRRYATYCARTARASGTRRSSQRSKV